MREGVRTRGGLALSAGVLVAALLPAAAAAQIPGGRSVDFGQERATFLAAMLEQVRPFMASWQGAWRGEVGPSIPGFYAPDAVVTVGDSLMGGDRTLEAFARSARKNVASLTPSMLDFDASNGLAYIYGAWTAQGATDGQRANGRVVTLLRRSGDDWSIRAQLFGADSVAQALFNAVGQAEPMPSLERRVAVGAKAFVPSGQGERERQDSRSLRRIAVFRDLLATLASFRSAWSADDPDAITALLRDNAWVQPPGVADWAGRVTSRELEGVLSQFGNLYTRELDFDYGGTMAYLSGRYYVERSSAPTLSGNYMAVFQNLGSGWLIRSLVFF